MIELYVILDDKINESTSVDSTDAVAISSKLNKCAVELTLAEIVVCL